MASKGLDWGAVHAAARDKRLLQLLNGVARVRWADRSVEGASVLHYSAYYGDSAATVAVLREQVRGCCAGWGRARDLTRGVLHQRALLEGRNAEGWTPAINAATGGQARVLEVLMAAGADMRAPTTAGDAPLDRALRWSRDDCLRLLVANGVRLSTVRLDIHPKITPWMRAFEAGVLRCRAAAVALLGAKRRRAHHLIVWDKFLVREVALAVWATRHELDTWE